MLVIRFAASTDRIVSRQAIQGDMLWSHYKWRADVPHFYSSFLYRLVCGDALDLSPDGHTILTGSWRPHDTLQLWDFATGKLMETIPFAGGPGGVGADRPELLYAAAWAPDGERFAAGGCGTHEAKIFRSAPSSSGAAPPQVVERISAYPGGVYCIAFSPSGKRFAMGGGAPGVTVVDV